MVEIGTAGIPWRAAAVAAGTALAAESEGAHAFWYPDLADDGAIPESGWSSAAGDLARVVPDPDDVADPIVSAVVALMVTRRMKVGVLGWDPGADVVRAARTLASVADVAPGRAVVAFSAPDDTLAMLAKLLRQDLDIELAVHGDRPGIAGELGWGWLATGLDAATLERTARECGVRATVGIHLRVVVHADASIALRALDAPLLRALDLGPDRPGVVVGAPDAVDAAIDGYVAAGVTRIVLENLLPLGAPDALEAAQAALRGSIRSARLRHRNVGSIG